MFNVFDQMLPTSLVTFFSSPVTEILNENPVAACEW